MSNKQEAEKEFEFIVREYIQPLLPTRGELECFTNAAGNTNTLIELLEEKEQKCFRIYPAKNTPQIYCEIGSEIDNRDDKSSLRVARIVLDMIMQVSQYTFSTKHFPSRPYHDVEINGNYVYRINRYATAFELGICTWLGGKAIFRLLDKLGKWTQKTYEGKRIPFSFIIDAKKKARGAGDFIEFLDSNHSAVFTDGFTSGIALDNDGRIVEYFSSSTPPLALGQIPFAPYRFTEFAKRCHTDPEGTEWIGIIAQINGDTLIFKNNSLVFAKRSGKWFYINNNRIIKHIENSLPEGGSNGFAKGIYLSLLDASFAHTGACLAVIDAKHDKTVRSVYIANDDLDGPSPIDKKNLDKRNILTKLMTTRTTIPNRLFCDIDRKLRQELLGLDGATVLGADGNILGSGAIVSIPGGSDEGGRTAAARELSRFGFAVKVSMDGGIQGFRDKNRIFSLFA